MKISKKAPAVDITKEPIFSSSKPISKSNEEGSTTMDKQEEDEEEFFSAGSDTIAWSDEIDDEDSDGDLEESDDIEGSEDFGDDFDHDHDHDDDSEEEEEDEESDDIAYSTAELQQDPSVPLSASAKRARTRELQEKYLAPSDSEDDDFVRVAAPYGFPTHAPCRCVLPIRSETCPWNGTRTSPISDTISMASKSSNQPPRMNWMRSSRKWMIPNTGMNRDLLPP